MTDTIDSSLPERITHSIGGVEFVLELDPVKVVKLEAVLGRSYVQLAKDLVHGSGLSFTDVSVIYSTLAVKPEKLDLATMQRLLVKNGIRSALPPIGKIIEKMVVGPDEVGLFG